MKKKRLIMTAALLSAFCMSAAGCSLYPGNKETQPANASQAETETKDETKQQPTGETEEETEKPTDAVFVVYGRAVEEIAFFGD